MLKKILTYQQLARVVKAHRDLEQTIVLTQGTYDMVHVGHGRYLQDAKKRGDVLIVGVDSDEKVRQRKGVGRPIVPEEERVEMLTYFSSVDHVVIKPLQAEKWSLIKLVRPDVLIVTEEAYTPEQLEQLSRFCGQVEVLSRKALTSTSAKIRQVQMCLAKEKNHGK